MTEEQNEKKISFFCKECKELAEVHRDGKKYVFNCKKCGGNDIAYGTLSSVKDFFHLKNI